MLKYLYKYLLIFFAAVFTSACVEMPEADLSEYITFEISELITKGSEPADESTEFAIWIYNEGKPYISADNYRLKYDSNSSCWRFYNVNTSQFEDIEWKTGSHEFYAFSVCEFYQGESKGMSYPNLSYYYGPSANFSLSALNMTDPTDPSDPLKKNYFNDLLRAFASCEVNSSKDKKPVQLQFNHVFASLKFTVHNNTQETKEVSAFEISNIQISTSSASTISSHPEYDSFAALGDASKDNKYSVAEGFTLASGESRDVFNGPVMVWPQSWDTGNKPKLTITSNGVTTVTDIGLGTASTQSWEKGVQYDYVINLNTETPPVIIEPSALSVEHVWENDILTGSKVIVNLNLTEAQKERITNLKIEVTDGSTVYKSYSSDTVEDNNIEFDRGDKYYIKSGTYNVKFTYNDGIADREVTKTVTSTTPNYNFKIIATVTESSYTIHSAKVSIAERVLQEVPLKPHATIGAYIRVTGNNLYDITSASTNTPEFISNYTGSATPEISSTYYRKFSISNFAYFDDLKDQTVKFETVNVCEGTGKISTQLFVTQYSRGDKVTHCNDITSDGLYLIQNKNSQSYYLSVANNGRLEVSTITSTSDIPIKNVLQFDVDANKNLTIEIEEDYYHESYAGVFRSAMNMKYMNTNTGYPYFDQSEAANGRYLKCADGWGSNDATNTEGSDICFTGNYVLVYGTYPYFTTPTGNWKWHIYKVNAEKKSY